MKPRMFCDPRRVTLNFKYCHFSPNCLTDCFVLSCPFTRAETEAYEGGVPGAGKPSLVGLGPFVLDLLLFGRLRLRYDELHSLSQEN